MIFRFFKKLDIRGMLYFPRFVVEKFGKEFYMEVYEDKIILVPIKPKKEEK